VLSCPINGAVSSTLFGTQDRVQSRAAIFQF
jgi:hypothetical protein